MMSSNPTPTTTRLNSDLADPISVVLSAPRRQHVLTALASGSEGGSSFDELAVAVTAFERVGRDDDSPGESSSRVAISLHHCHLPKLVDAGVVEEGYDEGDVELTPTGVECAEALGVGRFTR